MGASLRALRALALLAGFHLLGLVVLGALAGADYALFRWGPASVAVKLSLVSLLLAIPVVRGMFMLGSRRNPDDYPPGLPVDADDEPQLWHTVRELAEQVGTRAPDAIVLTAEVNAAVTEEARLLGLLPGRRLLFLGVPLLQGLNQAQSRSVIAHELGHYSHSDTRLGPAIRRGRDQLLRTIGDFEARADRTQDKERARQERRNEKRLAKGREAREIDPGGAGFTYRVMARLYTGYAKFSLRATLADARRQEYAADATAARIAGRDATASALREIPVLDSAHGFYLRSYALMGTDAGLLPPRGAVFGGFGELLSARALQLLPLRDELPDEPVSPYGSHPPIADRVRRIEELPTSLTRDESPAAGSAATTTSTASALATATDSGKGAALDLLADPARTLEALEEAVLTPDARAMRRAADWPELLTESSRARLGALDSPLHRALADYTRDVPTMAVLLRVIDDGQLWQLARRLPLSERTATVTGRAFQELVRPALVTGVTGMVLAELAGRSRLSWTFSWSEAAEVRLAPEGTEHDPEAAVAAALADRPDTEPLKRLLLDQAR
ncbi:M48 family metallopeptidase [Streptomyces paludis]|uniref:Peptidase n=1 Tax=Streptomyces paludis TaxID=2282738 RepID=A0A345HS64_9ACTN|nr:M48 family metallopeptidase [Streptomyces paludis]AXG79538.1 peptidase [Streptomyces paludis]